jgi:MinD-like ATPase involved in chromosome partitioning or flagellar assembly
MFADFAAIDLDTLLAEPNRGAPHGPYILALGSGSRGCGKTTLCWLLALTLSRLGHRTILLDSDLAAAGLYGLSGAPGGEQLLRRFLQTRGEDINILPQWVDNKNLYLITGSPAISGHAQLSFAAKQKLLLHLRKLRAEYVIIDAGQGASYLHLDFFLAADLPIIVAHIPNSSLLETYQFIRIGFFRKIQHSARHWPELFGYVSTLGEITQEGAIKTIPAFIASHREPHAHACAVIQNGLAAFQPKLIINRAEATLERRRVQSLLMVTHEVLGVTLTDWGEIREDDKVGKAHATGKPDLLLRGSAGVDIAGIIRQRLLNHE